jgi:hypothetical protein
VHASSAGRVTEVSAVAPVKRSLRTSILCRTGRLLSVYSDSVIMFIFKNVVVAVFTIGTMLAVCEIKQCAWRRLML